MPSLQMPNNNRADWWMYPDVFNFKLIKEEYQQHWSMLKSSIHYLVTKDMLLKSVNWNMHTWKQIKAGVGYAEDHCHPVRIQMAMQKLLYFGYLNGFNHMKTVNLSPEFLKVYPLSVDFLTACQQPRNNNSSSVLQDALITFYNENSAVLRGWNHAMPLKVEHSFGDSYLTGDSLETFARLDPQNPTLDACQDLSIKHTLPGSVLRELLIEEKMKKLINNMDEMQNKTVENDYKLALAALYRDTEILLVFRPSLLDENSSFFVRLYFLMAEQTPFDNEADYYNKAYAIIKKLDNDLAFPYLKKYFLNNDSAYSVIEKNDELLSNWLKHMYAEVVTYPKNMDNRTIGYRILTDKPTLIEDQDLTVYIDMALLKNANAQAIKLIERLYLINHGLAFQYLNDNLELVQMLPDDNELRRSFAEKVASQPTFTMNVFKLYNEPFRLFAHTKSTVLGLAKRLDPSIEDHSETAASFRFAEQVRKLEWDSAWKNFADRQQKNLPVSEFKQQDKAALAKYFCTQATVYSEKADQFKSMPEGLVEAGKNYYQSIDVLISAIKLHDTQECRFKLNRHCRLLMDVLLSQQPKSKNNYNETVELLTLIQDNPCKEKDQDLARTLVRLKIYFNSELTSSPSPTLPFLQPETKESLGQNDISSDRRFASMV